MKASACRTDGGRQVDDTTALKRAVAALDPAKGKNTLYLDGSYAVTEAIAIPSNVDVLGGEISRRDGPAVEFRGSTSGISFRDVRFRGARAAVYQHGGRARHVYFQGCQFVSEGDGPIPSDVRGYRQRTGDGILFTDVEDSSVAFCTFTCGRAGVAVEGKMKNLSVVRCIVAHAPSLTGFYFDAAESGPALLLNNTAHCNMGYALTARAVQDLVVRGLSTEGMGVGLPKQAVTGPMYEILRGSRVDLEMISLANLQLGRPGYQHTTWEGPQLRLNGRDNTIAGATLLSDATGETKGLVNASLESNDPNLRLWQVHFPWAKLVASGPSEKRVVLASRFLDGEYPAMAMVGSAPEEFDGRHLPVSPPRRIEPALWGPPAPRFAWRNLGCRSVRLYGAVGDGHADDTAAFQRAIAEGERLHVPAGTYRITAPLCTPHDNRGLHRGLAMVGDGMGKTVLVADTAVPGLLLFCDS